MSAGHETAGTGKVDSRKSGVHFMLSAGGEEKQRIGVKPDWILRFVFAVVLAVIALATMVAGGGWFAGFIAAVTVAGVREWHRMVTSDDFFIYIVISASGICAALATFLVTGGIQPVLPFLILATAALVNFVVAAIRGHRSLWQAAGPLYLGIPGVTLFNLRTVPEYGIWLVLVLFLAVWAADTGALFSGKLIGGPRLAPVLSPNKTWAGFIGGVMLAAATIAGAMVPLGSNWARGAAFGAGLALVSHSGDLFESWVKRSVGRKDSGHLIPGHGGVLDRIDSILFAAPVCAVLVFLFGVQRVVVFFGVHS